jgi:hypothetical protein
MRHVKHERGTRTIRGHIAQHLQEQGRRRNGTVASLKPSLPLTIQVVFSTLLCVGIRKKGTFTSVGPFAVILTREEPVIVSGPSGSGKICFQAPVGIRRSPSPATRIPV